MVAGQTISAVEFTGTKRTKEDFLYRWLTSKQGDSLHHPSLEEDLKFLQNLSIFSSVAYTIETDTGSINQNAVITFTVEESLALLPIIGIGGIQENVNIQIGLADYNVGGRTGQAAFIYNYYDRHSFQAYLHQRYIRTTPFGIAANIERRATLEPVYVDTFSTTYLATRWVVEMMPGIHINRFIYVQGGGAWLKETYTNNNDIAIFDIGLPEVVDTEKWLFKILITADRRQYDRQHVGGWVSQLHAEHINSPFDPVPFFKVFNENKWYVRGGDGNYAGRLRLGVATNTFSPFPPFVLDSYVNIRGAGNRIARGSAEVVLNQEYRYTLYENNWGAFQLVGFSDLGTLRPAGGTFKDMLDENNVVWRTGAGGRIYMSRFYHLFLRADFGFNPLKGKENGFVLGLGQYF